MRRSPAKFCSWRRWRTGVRRGPLLPRLLIGRLLCRRVSCTGSWKLRVRLQGRNWLAFGWDVAFRGGRPFWFGVRSRPVGVGHLCWGSGILSSRNLLFCQMRNGWSWMIGLCSSLRPRLSQGYPKSLLLWCRNNLELYSSQCSPQTCSLVLV